MPVKFTHERAGRLLAGVSVAALTILGCWHHPLWFVGLGGTACNLIWSAVTDRCLVKNLLVRLGFPGERDLGRMDFLCMEAEKTTIERTSRKQTVPAFDSKVFTQRETRVPCSSRPATIAGERMRK